jgi:hypothetical protein
MYLVGTLGFVFRRYEDPLKPERRRALPVLTKVAESDRNRRKIDVRERNFGPSAAVS